MPARADLHVHSKFSNRPTEWLLQRAAAAESYTEPLDLYRKAKARGMDFVTISDHDTIDGALEIAHLPGAFLSCEATVTFPEDGCQIHLLTFGITEAQFGTIDRLRGNVYELRDYLKGEGILCSVAHPLFRVNERLTLAHLEKLLVLFDRFEARNGIHDAGEADLVRRILSSLTPEMAWDLAERHRLEFWGERPWEKSFTGGSDDHGGHYIATTWTETPDADEPFGYLAHLHAGLAEPGGEAGSSRRLTQSLYAIAADWHRRAVPFWALGARFDPFARLLGDLARPAETARRESDPVERASAVGREVVRKLARRIERKVKRGKFGSALEGLAELAPLGLALAPHLIAVRAQSKDRDLIASAAARFGAGRTGGEKRLWWIDDPEELAAPTAAARGLFAEVARRGGSIEAVLCGPGNPDSPAGDASGFEIPIRRFESLLTLPLGEPGGPDISLPPLLEILDWAERERPAEIVVGMPGPLGLAGLLVAKLLRLPVAALVRTDLPAAAHRLTREVFLEDLTRDVVRWFYGLADRLLVATRFERELLIAEGFAPERIEIVTEAETARVAEIEAEETPWEIAWADAR